ncbi:hypothetical protein GQ457_14G003150 [Hibiscus cannabinus]
MLCHISSPGNGNLSFNSFYIRNNLVDNGSLWVAWIKTYAFKGIDFWDMVSQVSMSWTLHKLLKLRGEAKDYFVSVHTLDSLNRLLKWGVPTSAACMLCEDGEESHSHLFSECCFVTRLWEVVFGLNGLVRDVVGWERDIDWASRWKGKTLCAFVLRVSWNATVYHIWEECNRRQFQGEVRTLEALLNVIKEKYFLKSQLYVGHSSSLSDTTVDDSYSVPDSTNHFQNLRKRDQKVRKLKDFNWDS